ncbi:uncharacterized protein LOC106720251 [Papilio machaon]|nr:uncharacterized protein LOC106720251 [Papilio machaon]
MGVAIGSLTSHIQTAIKDCSRQMPESDNQRWALPPDARDLLRRKNAATRAHDLYPTESNRKQLRKLQREVKTRIAAIRNERWDSTLRNIKPSHLAFWKLPKSLKGDTYSTMPPLSRPNTTPAMLDEEKAECLADSLEAQCSPSSLPVDPDHLRRVNSEVDRRKNEPLLDSIPPVTSDEVEELIKNLRPRKAPGSDGITNRVAKLFPVAIIQLLVAIYNAAMTKGVFPSEWKDAEVIGFLKPSKPPSNPTSYRPISLLKTLGKIYERLILARLRTFMDTKGMPIAEQFGFRAKHSCTNQVHRITEHILVKRQRGLSTGAIFLDVAKAFDKVWHNGLIYKLYEHGVPDRLVCIIRDFLSNRTFRYRVEGVCSQLHPVRAGVPQGSVLGPVLFTLYTNDIPRVHGVELALFADDTCVYTSGRSPDAICRRLQTAANTLGAWFRKWRIEINPSKSAALYFSRQKGTALPSIKLLDSPIPWEDQVKYLGVILDSKLNFSAHVTRVIQNRFLRRATGAPWYMRNSNLHIDLDLPTIAQHLKLASRRYFDSAVGHPNPLVVVAATYNPIALAFSSVADSGVSKSGAYKYEDGTRYVGDWNSKGQKHGMGHLLLPDGTRYDGCLASGMCSGLGVMAFPDGAKYEGEFMQGWFHGHGVFWRADGMKFEGEFRGGRVWGLGLVTFSDGSNGFPRNEGFFQDCKMVRRKRCPEVVQRAQKVAYMARAQCQQV